MSFQYGTDGSPPEEFAALTELMEAVLNQIGLKGGLSLTGSGNLPFVSAAIILTLQCPS